MSLSYFLELLRTLGGAAGAIVTIVGLWTLIAKKPTQWFKKIIKEEITESNREVISYIDENNEDRKKEFQNINCVLTNIESQLDLDKEATICALRHSITKVYEEYKSKKSFSLNIKEDICKMYESYSNLGGNSYVHVIYEEMMEWDVI